MVNELTAEKAYKVCQQELIGCNTSQEQAGGWKMFSPEWVLLC